MSDKVKKEFSSRLNQAMDDAKWPPKGEGRQVALGRQMKLTQKAARKWTEGEGFPSMKHMVSLAVKLKVSVEWLATGRGPKHVPTGFPDDLQDLIDSYRLLPNRGKAEVIGYTAYVMDREKGISSREKIQILRDHATKLREEEKQ